MEPVYPKVPEYMGYILEGLDSLGFCVGDSMGVRGITWTELQSWSQITGFPLQSWEAKLLHLCSGAFAEQWAEAHDPICPSPWDGAKQDHSVLKAQLKSFFMARKNGDQDGND